MALKSDAKFKEELTCGFKYDVRRFWIFKTQKSENFFLMGSFCTKYTRFELQKYRVFIFNDSEQWCKIWTRPDLAVSKIAWGIAWTFIRALKSLKICTLMVVFCAKHIMFSLENFIGIMCRDTEKYAEFKGKLDHGLKKWHKAFG